MVKEPEVKSTSLWSAMARQAILWFKPNLKTKGAILILVRSFLLMNVYNYLTVYANRPNGHTIETVVLSFTLPLAGWLADVYLGRYKVIRWSMWIMWVGSMLATVSSVVAQLVDHSHYKIIEDFTVVLLFITTIGFGGYAGNIIQFGMDQLHDASTTEITAFISWLIWTYSSSSVIFQFIHMCMKKKYYHILGQLLVCISTAAVIASSFVLDTTLVKEPVTQNPFKLVYKVIRYAIKTKHPRCRSAFTYWEDELPSRIDFGKSKYGGPFTTEQVEDVKTFLRLLPITAIASMNFISHSDQEITLSRNY
jgi:peptide/histidine transporter 3/4